MLKVHLKTFLLRDFTYKESLLFPREAGRNNRCPLSMVLKLILVVHTKHKIHWKFSYANTNFILLTLRRYHEHFKYIKVLQSSIQKIVRNRTSSINHQYSTLSLHSPLSHFELLHHLMTRFYFSFAFLKFIQFVCSFNMIITAAMFQYHLIYMLIYTE